MTTGVWTFKAQPVDPTAPPTPQGPAERSLSDGASKIVADLRLRPDTGRLCGDGDSEAFRDAMREARMTVRNAVREARRAARDAYRNW